MKRLLYCFLFVFTLMACSTRPSIMGRWAMEMSNIQDTSFILNGDTIVTPELRIEYDSIYMEVWSNGLKVKDDNLGVYSIKEDQIIVTDRYGKQLTSKFKIEGDTLFIMDINDPSKIIMRLVRIKEE